MLASSAALPLLSGCFAVVELPGGALAVLGGGSHSPENLVVEIVADAADGLDAPRDLAFNPNSTSELWIVNEGNHSVTIVTDAGSEDANSEERSSGDSQHFMARPSALAFAGTSYLATIHEEDELTQGDDTPEDFMGPTLWPASASDFDGGGSSHLDMLHNSPNGVGIAWERDAVFWVFDGYHEALTRYDFGGDHGEGGEDHSDGEVARFAEGEVAYEPGVSSHMGFHEGRLYVADTGNARIAVLDPQTGTEGGSIDPNYDGGAQYVVEGAVLESLTSGPDLTSPSGLEVRDGLLFASDSATGRILAFALDGTLVDWLETGRDDSALMGLAFDDEGRLYVVDSAAGEVIRYADGE